jgi:hypothetical protein
LKDITELGEYSTLNVQLVTEQRKNNMYQIGDVVYYKTSTGLERYGKIRELNNGYYTIESFAGYASIVNPKDIIKKKE